MVGIQPDRIRLRGRAFWGWGGVGGGLSLLRRIGEPGRLRARLPLVLLRRADAARSRAAERGPYPAEVPAAGAGAGAGVLSRRRRPAGGAQPGVRRPCRGGRLRLRRAGGGEGAYA